MYTVIGSPMTRAMRVIHCLEELGLDYKINPAKPGSDEVKTINPSGKVPALIDGDDIIFDSNAIMLYLTDKHNDLTFPAGTIERAHMDSWLHFIIDEIDAPLWVWWKHTYILPEDQRIDAIKPACKAEFDRAMTTMEARLGDNEFLMGDTFTVPDIVMAHCASWAQLGCKFPLPKGKLGDYLKRIRTRPALLKAAKEHIKK